MNETPGQYWRRMLRESTFHAFRPSPGDEDEQFRRYVAQLYRDEHARFKALQLGSDAANAASPGVFILAVAACASGQIDAALEVLALAPPLGDPMWPLTSSLAWLLPLPPDFDVHRDAERIKVWIKVNQSRLYWCEQEGRYRLRSAGEAPCST